MDVAITGASGLIGRALTASLEADGHRVLRFTRRRGGGPDTAYWNPDTGDIDAGALEGIDAVVHLAGEPLGEKRWTVEQKDNILHSRTRGTSLIARTAAERERPPRTLLSSSGINYYGDTGEHAVDESGEPGEDFLAEVCVEWEAAAHPAANAGLRVCTMRTGIVLSGEGGALQRQLPYFRFGLGGRMGNGKQWQSWISQDDAVGAIRWLLDHDDIAGPVNLVSPAPVTNGQFARTLGRVLRRPTTIIPVFAPKLLYGSELVDSLLLTSMRVLPRVLEESGYPFRHSQLEDALRDAIHKDRAA